MGERVPVGDAEAALVVERHHILLPHQHPVERPRRGDQILARARADQRVDEGVHRRVGDAYGVAAAGAGGGDAAPVVLLLVAGRQGHPPAPDRHVEVVVLEPRLILGAVHQAHRRLDAQALQAALVGQGQLLARLAAQQDLEGEGLAVAVD